MLGESVVRRGCCWTRALRTVECVPHKAKARPQKTRSWLWPPRPRNTARARRGLSKIAWRVAPAEPLLLATLSKTRRAARRGRQPKKAGGIRSVTVGRLAGGLTPEP